MEITLGQHGDDLEKSFHRSFALQYFPSYEQFWLREVVPITHRIPPYFKTDDELRAMGKSVLHWYCAQLHYSVLFHLGVSHGIAVLSDEEIEYNRLTASLTHLVGATDIAFELLQWWKERDEWTDILLTCKSHAKNSDTSDMWCLEQWARNPGLSPKKKPGLSQTWRKENGCPLEEIRQYRNAMVHRGVRSIWSIENIAWFPRIGKQELYCDWRQTRHPQDYAPASSVLWPAWKETASYIESQWKEHLLA